MSYYLNLFAAYATVFFVLLSVAFILLFIDQRHFAKLYKDRWIKAQKEMQEWKSLAEGIPNLPARRWREIAFDHAKDHRRTKEHFEREHKYLKRLIDAFQQRLNVRDWEFEMLVTFIWGYPPLDRSMQNVFDFISELRGQPRELMKVSVAQNMQMQKFAQHATDLERQLHELQKKYDAMLEYPPEKE